MTSTAQRPSAGRIVRYKLAASDVTSISRRRRDAAEFRRRTAAHPPAEPGGPGRTGHVAHTGSAVAEGDTYPAVVVRVTGPATCNLQVLLDGNDTLWVTSRTEGGGPGEWSWPPRM